MNNWRITLAQKIAPIYASISDIAAVALLGGVARGLCDQYSDLDIACFWHRTPTEDERHAAMLQFESVLNTPVFIRGFETHMAFPDPEHGLFWEEVAYIGGDDTAGFKIDVNHRTVAAMQHILDDVVLHLDANGHKLETLYSIRRVIILHGAPIIEIWQSQAAIYPDALAEKLLQMHLPAMGVNLDMHLFRGELFEFYRMLTEAIFNLVAALLALNHIYRPSLKRLASLADEMPIKPPHLAPRINALMRTDPTHAMPDFYQLATEVFALVEQHMPYLDLAAARAKFSSHRQPFDSPPIEL
ncbi:MAG: nucleotidyltransferase domain-containing protein [Chloroflexi bacterium]|nr:nucleotidyltransferase domain-containing protein [Chloroflexota bacterium]